jgi:hypothetical protein
MTVMDMVQFLAAPTFPSVMRIPTNFVGVLSRFKSATDAVAKALVQRGAKEIDRSEKSVESDKSMLGLLSE